MQSKPVEIECGSVVHAGESVPGRELSRRAGAIARALREANLRPGDRVALVTADDAAFFVAFAACLATGLTAVVIDPRAAVGEVARMLTRAAPRALVADGAVARALAGSSGVPSLAATILVGSDDADGGVLGKWRTWRAANPGAGAMRFDTITRNGDAGLEWRTVDDGVPAYVMFTSGTTSTPKGVVISRRALFRHVRTLADVFGYGPDATLLHYLPLHHTDGLVHGPCAALLTGMRVVRPGPFSPLAAEGLPDLLRDHRVTHFLAVPTILSFVQRIFATRPDLFRTGCFRHVISTAGYLNPEFWLEFETTFGLRLANFYGMTETVSGSLYCGPSDTSYRRGTLGTPVDCNLRIVGEDGAPCAAGEVGRLEIAGEHLMDGYLADPEASAEVLRDGWLDTGDLFRRDADGFFEFAGRRKTVIKRGGITVYPEDVRGALEPVRWVREVEVIGAPDPTFEQIVVVCAVLDPDKTAADVHAECTQRLAPERRPDRVLVMADLPRGPSGKVQRESLIERVMRAETDASRQDPIPDRVRAIAAEIFQVDRSTLSDATSPDDVPNWDSYAHIELAMALERNFALRLTPKELMQLRSIGHAVEIVVRRQTGART